MSPCVLCGSTARTVVLRHEDGDLARCRACGMTSVEPLPTPEAVLAQYDALYFAGGTGYRDYVAEEGVYRAEGRRRVRALRAAGGAGRLLDVGCASGAFLVEARTALFHVTGVEPAVEMAAVARERARCEVVAAPVEAAELPRASFEVVTAFDSLEHVVDPVGVLRRFREWLVPGGLLAVTVPDFGGLWARLTGRRWPFVTPKEHLHYFTRRTLAAAIAAAGFGPPRFAHAGTPASYGTLAYHGAGPLGPALERALGRRRHRGLSLPFGTLFALARSRP